MKKLIEKNPHNPFYHELIGEIYFANNDYNNAVNYQKTAIKQINKKNDLYYMMIANYLINFEKEKQSLEAIKYLKKSIQLNPKNAYAWFYYRGLMHK